MATILGNASQKINEYLDKTQTALVQGDFSNKTTLLAVVVNLAYSIAGIDLPMDVRDTVANISKGDAPGAVLSGIGVLPIIVALKYSDEVIGLVKAGNKLSLTGEGVDAVKGTIRISKEMVSRAELIASGSNIRKSSELVEKFGGTEKAGGK